GARGWRVSLRTCRALRDRNSWCAVTEDLDDLRDAARTRANVVVADAATALVHELIAGRTDTSKRRGTLEEGEESRHHSTRVRVPLAPRARSGRQANARAPMPRANLHDPEPPPSASSLLSLAPCSVGLESPPHLMALRRVWLAAVRRGAF